MQDGQSRITVVGARKRVDVAVPSAAPIGEYVAGLAELCGQDRRSVLPAAWSLALAGAAPLPVGSSLAEGGVTDGQVLYLRDTTAGSGSDPVVEDVDEHVIGEAERQRRSGLPRGVVVMAAGLIWLTGGASLLAARHGHSEVSAAVGLACAALLLLALAWAMEVRKTAISAPLCLAISMTSIPCLAAAGALLAQALERPEFFWLGAIAGANAATVLILAATPEAVVFALELQFVAAAVLGPVLVAVRADVVQTATAVAIAALALLAMSKSVAATIAVLAKRARRDGFPMSQATTELLIRTRQLLVVVVGGPAFALTIVLPMLARSGSRGGADAGGLHRPGGSSPAGGADVRIDPHWRVGPRRLLWLAVRACQRRLRQLVGHRALHRDWCGPRQCGRHGDRAAQRERTATVRRRRRSAAPACS